MLRTQILLAILLAGLPPTPTTLASSMSRCNVTLLGQLAL